MRYALLAVGMLVVWVAPSFASVVFTHHDASYKVALIDDAPNIQVDWPTRTVFIITQAKVAPSRVGRQAYLAALDAALVKARQQVRVGLSGINITSYATVKDAIVTMVIADEYVEEACKSVRPVRDRWDASQRSITLLSALPMTGTGSLGELAARLLRFEQQSFKAHALSPVMPAERMTLRPPMAPVPQMTDGPYTGLILDCRGLHYQPTLLPKFIAEDGKEFWGTLAVSHVLVNEKGIAEYHTNFASALQAQRVGGAPLVVRPLGTAGLLQGDLVFSAGDAALMMEQEAISQFLTKLNIVMVID